MHGDQVQCTSQHCAVHGTRLENNMIHCQLMRAINIKAPFIITALIFIHLLPFFFKIQMPYLKKKKLKYEKNS